MSENMWVWGVVLSLVGSLMSNFGVQVEPARGLSSGSRLRMKLQPGCFEYSVDHDNVIVIVRRLPSTTSMTF